MKTEVQDQEARRARALVILAGVIAAVAVVWLLRAAAIVAVPLAAAFFVALVVHPVQVYVRERFPGHRWAAVPVAMGVVLAALGGGIWLLAESVDEAAEAVPRYSDRLQESWRTLQQAGQQYGLPLPDDLLGSSNVKERLASVAESTARAAWGIVSGLVLVLFLVLLMMLEAPLWRRGARRVLREGRGEMAFETIASIAEKVRQYLFVRTVLGLASAVLAGIWLLVLDIDLVLVWVALTFVLNYIPNLGSIIAVFPPTLMALLQHGPVRALIVLGGLAVFEQIIGNFIDPRMQGHRLRISPALVLVALVFWSWVWGPVGALLAVPMTVTLLAAAAHVRGMRPFVELLTMQADEDQEPVEGPTARAGHGAG